MKVLVTGTSNGIGKATAQKFLNSGHDVIGIDVEQATVHNTRYTHYVCDVRDTLPDIDSVEIIVTSAGIQLPDEDALSVNLNGTVNVVEKYAFQNAIKAVITIASASGRNGAEFPLYTASKGGVISYTKNVAMRLAKYGATANSVSPGGVKTKINKPITDNPKLWRAVLNESLLHKWCEPEEIAEWIYFLSVINKSMTGEDLLIDNGEILKSNFIWPKK